jgi:hypothetical protein
MGKTEVRLVGLHLFFLINGPSYFYWVAKNNFLISAAIPDHKK